MKLFKNLLLLLTAMLLVAGCKFETPLTDKPTRTIDPSLIGTWTSLSGEKPLEIYRMSDTQYLVIFEGDPFVCTHSDLSGTAFVSCRQLKNDSEYYGKYAYMGFRMEGKELVLASLSDSIGLKEKMTPTQQKALIAEAAKKGTALRKDELRYKKAPPQNSPFSSKR